MKRDKQLHPLSWQHHDELISCLLIKKGIKKNVESVILKDFIFTFWKDDLEKHMKSEEEILLPALARNHFEPHYIRIIKTDHDLIRILIERMQIFDESHRFFELFATLVEQHIRFEERFIFPLVQELIEEPEMDRLGALLGNVHTRNCNNYPIKFWE